MNLRETVEYNDTSLGRIFDFTIQFLIIVSLISFSLETLPNLKSNQKEILRLIEIICVIIFTIEYALRIIVSSNKLKFIFSFYGLIDLCAILPFYITTGIDLRTIRIFRLLRLFRLLKILRYNKALNRFHQAFKSIKEELIIFVTASSFLFYAASVGIYYFEHLAQPEKFSSIFHSLWWAIITLATIGYGDMYPITVGGKIFTSFIILIGIGIIAVPSGLIASAMSKVVNEEKDN